MPAGVSCSLRSVNPTRSLNAIVISHRLPVSSAPGWRITRSSTRGSIVFAESAFDIILGSQLPDEKVERLRQLADLVAGLDRQLHCQIALFDCFNSGNERTNRPREPAREECGQRQAEQYRRRGGGDADPGARFLALGRIMHRFTDKSLGQMLNSRPLILYAPLRFIQQIE